MGDLFDEKESQYGTEVEQVTTTVAPVKDEDYKTVQPFEGKSFTFRTQWHEAENRVCVVNERGMAIAIDDELANSLVNSVSRAATFFKDMSQTDYNVKLAVMKSMPTIKDGIIPKGTVTAENVESARKARAELNKLWENLEKERKTGKSIMESPYSYINGIYKNKTSLLTSVLAELKSQIDKVDKEADEKKKETIKALILKKAVDYNRDLPALLEKYESLYNKVWQDKFLNKTMSDTKMQEEIMRALNDIANDLKAIESESDNDNLRASYYETGNLSDALKRRQQVQEARRFAEELQRRSKPVEPIATPEPEKVSVTQPEVENAPSRAPEKPVVTLTDFGPGKDQYFHCWNANPEEFTGLIAYMKAHGFRCEGIKKIVDYYKSLN